MSATWRRLGTRVQNNQPIKRAKRAREAGVHDEPPADHGAVEGAEGEGGGHHLMGVPPLGAGVHAPHRRQHDGEHGAGADALDGAHGHQHALRTGHGAEQGADDEDGRAGCEHLPGTVDVGELACGGEHGDLGDDVHREHPFRVDIVPDVRDHHEDVRELHDHPAHAGDEHADRQADDRSPSVHERRRRGWAIRVLLMRQCRIHYRRQCIDDALTSGCVRMVPTP